MDRQLGDINKKLNCIIENTSNIQTGNTGNTGNTGGGLGEPEEVLEFLNYPFINKGFSKIIIQEQQHVTKAKQITGGGISQLRDIEKVEVTPGYFEYWAIGKFMTIFRYDENMDLLGQVANLYGAANNNNNLIQYTYDMHIDYANDKIYFAMKERHVVRVYQFSTIRDNNFVSGNPQTGGHLYDIGVIDTVQDYWLISNTPAKHVGLGYLSSPRSIEKNHLNNNIIIADENGYAENQTTVNEGFVAEYSPIDGSFQRTIIQVDGINNYNGNVNSRSSTPKSTVIINDTLHVICDEFYINKYNLQNLTTEVEINGPYYNDSYTDYSIVPNKLEVDTDNNLLVCHHYQNTVIKTGMFKLDSNFNIIGQVGYDGLGNNDPYKLQYAHCVVNVGDRGLGVGDWYIVGNGVTNNINLVCMGKISNGNILPANITYFETDASLEINKPSGWSITSYIGSNSVFHPPTNKLLTPIQYINENNELTALIEKL